MTYIPYRQHYLGDRRLPVANLKHKNAYTKERELRHELYIKFKKLKQTRRREQLFAEMRQKGYRINQG